MSEYLTTEYQQKLFDNRYAQIKANADKETLTEMFERLATGAVRKEIILGHTSIEQKKNYLTLLSEKYFLPGGRIIANLGGTGNGMLGNCFVVPITDSRKGIMKNQADTFEIYAHGGGVGTNYSPLRPKGAEVKGVGSSASGPCSFIDAADHYAETIKQGSSHRRAAKMTILNVEHPDILEFISAKTDHKRWNNTNISVGISDAFMTAVEQDKEWVLKWGEKVYHTFPARDIWNEICRCAWKSAEPGVVFLDTIQNKYPLNYLYKVDCTNPCQPAAALLWDGDRFRRIDDPDAQTWTSWEVGEKEVLRLYLSNQASVYFTPEHMLRLYNGKSIAVKNCLNQKLLSADGLSFLNVEKIQSMGQVKVWNYQMNHYPFWNICQGVIAANCGELPLASYGMCLLGHMILPSFVVDGKFDWQSFIEQVSVATCYLDALIDVSKYPLPENEEIMLKTRPVGLGITGLADALFLLKLPYGNHKETLDFCHQLGATLYGEAQHTSERLAQDLGAFPAYDLEQAKFPARRNSTLLAIAPTGTITGLAGLGGYGIEPFSSPSVIRNETLGRDVVNIPIVDKYLFDNNLIEMPDWARFVGGVDDKYLLTIEDHLEVLKVFAHYVDSAIAKTVGLPRTATIEEVAQVFTYCWKNGIKGCTVYRDGSREDQPITWNEGTEEEDVDEEDYDIELVSYVSKPKERPRVLEGRTFKIKPNPNDPSLYVTVNECEGELFEVFFKTNNAYHQEFLDMLSRSMTTSLRRGISIEHLIKEFCSYESPSGGNYYKNSKGQHFRLKSISHAIGLILKEALWVCGSDDPSISLVANDKKIGVSMDMIKDMMPCPECGALGFKKVEGCELCEVCGLSRCT